MIDYTATRHKPARLDVSDIPNQCLGLTYPAPNGELRSFDLYRPSTGKGPFPVLVSVAGGGWFFGHTSSSHLGRQIHTAVSRGYAFVSMACTSSGEQKFPYQIRELNLFLSYLKEHALQFDLDIGFLGLLAASSGAHLSLLAALTRSDPYFAPNTSAPVPKISAVAAIYPPCRLDAGEEDFEALGLRSQVIRSGPRCAEAIFLGVEDIRSAPELIRLGSPTYHIGPQAPPVMILQGMADTCVPYTFTLEFVQRYREIAGTENILAHFIPGADHSDPRFKDETACHAVMDFFERVRRGETPCPPHLQNKDIYG